MNQHITVVTGSYPPDVCGVGDYTRAFVRQLQSMGADVELFYRKDWSRSRIREYLVEIQQSNPSYVVFQYPTEGYGYSLVPQMLCALVRSAKKVVTLHEFSSKSVKGKIAILVFFIFADCIVFTTDAEKSFACRYAPWLKKKSVVIPIGANIPFVAAQDRDIHLAYFGLIRPRKGLELFLDVASAIAGSNPIKITLIGKIVPGYESYGLTCLQRAKEIGVDIVLDKSDEDVARILSRCRIALLPFPDGVSCRRGSALAAMANGALVVTTAPSNERDRQVFRHLCAMQSSDSSLYDIVREALENRSSFDDVRMAGQRFARSITWESVVTKFMSALRIQATPRV